MKAYHGSSKKRRLSGKMWFALDLEYAAGYAGPGGVVRETDISGLSLLDLRGLGIYPTIDDLRDALLEAGVDAPEYLGRGAGEEDTGFQMHDLTRYFETVTEARGYDGILIHEETDGVGETDSALIFHAENLP